MLADLGLLALRLTLGAVFLLCVEEVLDRVDRTPELYLCP